MDKVGRERTNGKRRVPVERHRMPGRGERGHDAVAVRALALDVSRRELEDRLRAHLRRHDALDALDATVAREIASAKRRTAPLAPSGPSGTTNDRRFALLVSPEYEQLSDRDLAALSILAGIPPLSDFPVGQSGREALRAEEKRIRNARLGRSKLSPREAKLDAPRRPRMRR